MTLVGLLRHGEVKGGACFRGHTDDPLTDFGFGQMHCATHGYPCWDSVISSPLARCADFAKAFSSQHSLPYTVDARFKEMHFGAWEGRTAAELMAQAPLALKQFWDDPANYPPPDGEPLSHFQARVLDAWNDLTYYHAGQRVLLVSHGGVIRILLCHLQQRPISTLLSIEVKHGALFTVNADLNKVVTTKLVEQV